MRLSKGLTRKILGKKAHQGFKCGSATVKDGGSWVNGRPSGVKCGEASVNRGKSWGKHHETPLKCPAWPFNPSAEPHLVIVHPVLNVPNDLLVVGWHRLIIMPDLSIVLQPVEVTLQPVEVTLQHVEVVVQHVAMIEDLYSASATACAMVVTP